MKKEIIINPCIEIWAEYRILEIIEKINRVGDSIVAPRSTKKYGDTAT